MSREVLFSEPGVFLTKPDGTLYLAARTAVVDQVQDSPYQQRDAPAI